MSDIKVKIHYFKKSGKWYTEEDWQPTAKHFWAIIKEFKDMYAEGNCPGLANYSNHFWVVLEVSSESEDWRQLQLVPPAF